MTFPLGQNKVDLSCWESAPLLFVCALFPMAQGTWLSPQLLHRGCPVPSAFGCPTRLRSGGSVGLLDSPPTDRLCKLNKSPGNLIWLHLMCFGSVTAGRTCWGHWQGSTEVNRTWLSTWSLAPAPAFSLPQPLSQWNKRDILAPFFPSTHHGDGERSVIVFPSLLLSCSYCLAQRAFANPLYLFIPHSWCCSWSTNSCHGK